MCHGHDRAQELCQNRGGRPGLPVPNKPTVSVDVKQHFNKSTTAMTTAMTTLDLFQTQRSRNYREETWWRAKLYCGLTRAQCRHHLELNWTDLN